jgi:hypothetical protein
MKRPLDSYPYFTFFIPTVAIHPRDLREITLDDLSIPLRQNSSGDLVHVVGNPIGMK